MALLSPVPEEAGFGSLRLRGESRESVPRFRHNPSLELGLNLFFARLERSADWALLVDYDGTLAPLTANRHAALPYPGVLEELRRVIEISPDRVSIVSGRPLQDLEAILAGRLPRRPNLWGSHGLERLTSQGLYSAIRIPARSRDFVDDAFLWICARGWSRFVERKPFGLALHGRGTRRGRFGAVCRCVCRRFASGARRSGLQIVAFDGGLEFRPAGRHKGQVIDRVFEELDRDPAVAYLGDDATDEDAFEALRGRGLAVLVRRAPRPTRADAWLKPPEELRDFLERWRRAVTSRRTLRDRAVRRAG